MEDIERVIHSVKVLTRWIISAGVLLIFILAHCWIQKQRIDELEQDFSKLVVKKEYLRGQYENLKKDVLRVESNVTHYNARVIAMEKEHEKHERGKSSSGDGTLDERGPAASPASGR